MPAGRNDQGRFQPGVSGNPMGRRLEMSVEKVTAARAVALKHCPRAIERLNQLMDDENGKVAVAAAVALLRVGGVLTSEADEARLARAVEQRLRELLAEAEGERKPPTPAAPEPPKMLEAMG